MAPLHLDGPDSRESFLRGGQEVCFCPSRPDPVRNAREQDGTRTGRDGPHLGTWMGPKHCKTKHMANLDGTTLDPGWDLDRTQARVWMAPPRDSNRLLGLSEFRGSRTEPPFLRVAVWGPKNCLVDVSDIFYFFCSGGGKGESEAPGGGGGSIFLLKIPREGGFSRRGRDRGVGIVSAANWGISGAGGGGGLNFFFCWGRNVHQEDCSETARRQ